MKSFNESTFGVLALAVDSVERQLTEQARLCTDSHIEMSRFLEENKDELGEDFYEEFNGYSASYKSLSQMIFHIKCDLEIIKNTLSEFYCD